MAVVGAPAGPSVGGRCPLLMFVGAGTFLVAASLQVVPAGDIVSGWSGLGGVIYEAFDVGSYFFSVSFLAYDFDGGVVFIVLGWSGDFNFDMVGLVPPDEVGSISTDHQTHFVVWDVQSDCRVFFSASAPVSLLGCSGGCSGGFW